MDTVRAAPGQVDDAVAGTDFVRLAALPREAAAGEDVEDLFLAAMLVRRRRPAARGHLNPSHPDSNAPRGAAEVRPSPAQVAEVELECRRLVEVGDGHVRVSRVTVTPTRSCPAACS